MLAQILLHLAVVVGLAAAQTVMSSCQDLDTGGCKIFQQSNPNLCSDPRFANITCRRFCGNCPDQTCKDLDTQGCQIFQHSNPNLCSDPNFANNTCKRFCGNCPIECFDCPNAVLHPDDCNTTSLCAPTQTCASKHYHATDGHDEYILTCEKKEICDGLNFGFGIIGKRHTDMSDFDIDHDGRIAKRGISLACCNTDLCNLPLARGVTTTVAPPTPIPLAPMPSTGLPQLTPSPVLVPGSCNKDIVFLLDDSGSVGTTNFQKAINFVKDLVSQLDVGPTKAQVSVMAFSTHPQIEWYLNTYHTQAQLQTALQTKVKYTAGTTHTGDALEATRTNILTLPKGDRSAVDNAVIVMTDGRSTNVADTAAKAAKLHGAAKDVIAIGVGSAASGSELAHIATDLQHVFSIAGYPNLQPLMPQILNIICS